MGVRELRQLPSVDRVLQIPAIHQLAQDHARELVVEEIRAVLEEARRKVQEGGSAPSPGDAAAQVMQRVEAGLRPSLRPVINASGVIVHTNLGRAPLSLRARQAIEAVTRGYSNLEFELEEGGRGSRHDHAVGLLTRLSGAEAALVVNNNAAALLLVLACLARHRQVLIARGQLVEIGGGFRIPEILAQSGAELVEVGTTNRTHLEDYAGAIGPRAAVILRVHHSNFRLAGFVHQPPLTELVELGRGRNSLVVDDLGSGTFLDTRAYGLAAEPTVQESVAAGADLVTFSGDKLLGGPQAGIIVGRAALIERLRRHPLTRALRVDKATLAGLQATFIAYLDGKAAEEIPVWRMIAAPAPDLKRRAEAWAEELQGKGLRAGVIEGRSTVGGGSLPEETLPTFVLALEHERPTELARALRTGNPAVVGRLEGERLLLDPRTVLPEEDEALLRALAAAY